MTQEYTPPQAYGNYPPIGNYNPGTARINNQPNYWGEVQKRKDKYYDDLTSHLLIVFSVRRNCFL